MSISTMALRSIRQSLIKSNCLKICLRKGSGGGHHGPNMPPFAQLRPPSEQLPEEVELVWDDGIAPETCIDFDASFVKTKEVLSMFVGSFAVFFGLYLYIKLYDPAGNSPVAPRSAVIPANTVEMFFGYDIPETAEGEDGEDEDEDDE